MNKLLVLLFLLINTSLLSQNNEGEIEDAQIIIQKNSIMLIKTLKKYNWNLTRLRKKVLNLTTLNTR